jgi:hypothetical protein
LSKTAVSLDGSGTSDERRTQLTLEEIDIYGVHCGDDQKVERPVVDESFVNR